MDSFFLLRARLHESQTRIPGDRLDESILNAVKAFIGKAWESISGALGDVWDWFAGPDKEKSVGETAAGLEKYAQELASYGIVTEDQELGNIEKAFMAYGREMRRRGIATEAGGDPLKYMGQGMARVLLDPKFMLIRGGGFDWQKQEEEQTALMAAFLERFCERRGVRSLANFLFMVAPGIGNMDEQQLRTVGYWMLKSLVDAIHRKIPDQDAIISSYIQGTWARDARKIVARYGPDNVYVHGKLPEGNKDLSDLFPLGTTISPRLVMSPSNYVGITRWAQEIFHWVKGVAEPVGYWVVCDKNGYIPIVVKEDEYVVTHGGMSLSYVRLADDLDKRRTAFIFFVHSPFVVGGDAGRLFMDEEDAAKASPVGRITFTGYHRVGEDTPF